MSKNPPAPSSRPRAPCSRPLAITAISATSRTTRCAWSACAGWAATGAWARRVPRNTSRPRGMMRGFAELPAQVAAFARAHERCAFVLLDAFGWAFVQRHLAHPFLQRLEIEPVAAQFPSPTTAHLTTLYTGLPVEQHGRYEWRIYEPAAGAVIRPLRFAPARDGDPPRSIDPQVLIPGPTLFERLDVPSLVLHPHAIADTRYGSVALAGARVAGYETIEEAAARLGREPGLTYL